MAIVYTDSLDVEVICCFAHVKQLGGVTEMRTWQHLPLMLSSCAVGSNHGIHFLLYLNLVVFLCFVF